MISKLSFEEKQILEKSVARCRDEDDALIRQIGVVYLRGLCDMLRVQGKLGQQDMELLMAKIGKE